jgi:peptidoglycan/xylan/chitin deacetylase (PgdA/CDA1 family)
MYHRVTEVDRCAKHPYYCTNTAARVFEEQIRFLRKNGYRAVSVTEAFEAVQSTALDERLVAITFDDGYQDFYTHAFPVLSRYGYSATVFLPTAYIGESSRRFKDAQCLTWNQVKELRRAGVGFGSHTVTHPQLLEVGPDQLRDEIAGSRKEIEQKLGELVTTFSYPFAFPEAYRDFVARLRGALQESGYRDGVSTIIGRVGRTGDPLFLNRLPINSHDDLRFFQAKLEGAYDWLHTLQYAAKLRAKRHYCDPALLGEAKIT